MWGSRLPSVGGQGVGISEGCLMPVFVKRFEPTVPRTQRK